MEKAIKRSILRRNQLLKKSRRQDLKDLRQEWRDYQRVADQQYGISQRLITQERKARREDWILGPLAPNRNTGTTMGRYGAMSYLMANGPTLPNRMVKGPRGRGDDAYGSEKSYGSRTENAAQSREWCGEGSEGNIVVGDRVVVVKGREGVQGRIGRVWRIEPKMGLVWISGVNKTDFTLPASALSKTERYGTTERGVPIKDVRLVVKMEDPEQGTRRDYIVRHMYGGAPYLERVRNSKLPRHTRYISGLDIELPWPADDTSNDQDYPGDTASSDVQTETYIPSVFLEPGPMQNGVIDELRKKHARERKSAEDDVDRLKLRVLQDIRDSWLRSRSLEISSTDKGYTRQVRNQHRAEAGKIPELDPETIRLIEKVQSINL